MSVLRINLHIRSDVSPKLYEALASMPAKPRAELLRKLAERGLQVAASSTHLAPTPTDDSTHIAQRMTVNSTPDNFSNDLAGLLEKDLN